MQSAETEPTRPHDVGGARRRRHLGHTMRSLAQSVVQSPANARRAPPPQQRAARRQTHPTTAHRNAPPLSWATCDPQSALSANAILDKCASPTLQRPIRRPAPNMHHRTDPGLAMKAAKRLPTSSNTSSTRRHRQTGARADDTRQHVHTNGPGSGPSKSRCSPATRCGPPPARALRPPAPVPSQPSASEANNHWGPAAAPSRLATPPSASRRSPGPRSTSSGTLLMKRPSPSGASSPPPSPGGRPH